MSRIIVANKFWYHRGGAENVMFDEIAALQSLGHEVAHFSTRHPENVPSPWTDYFVSHLELGPAGGLGAVAGARAAIRMFHNPEAARCFAALCTDFRPDLVHIHGIHRQLSPSILSTARRLQVPVVQTVHDYHHVCPADVLLYKGREVCEPRRCGSLWYGPAVAGRCVRNSVPASLLSATETCFQRLRRVYERGVARFVSPSEFLAARMREGGWSVPIDVVPNAVPVGREAVSGGGRGFCIVGRLSTEKGVALALDAARLADVPVTVAGDGPLASELRNRYPEVCFVGRLTPEGVAALIRRSTAVVVPSVWFENAPMSILETMAMGVPVVATAIGGIPEQVTDGADGLLVPPGDVPAIAAGMRRLVDEAGLAVRLGKAAQLTVAERFSPERHIACLVESYLAAGAKL